MNVLKTWRAYKWARWNFDELKVVHVWQQTRTVSDYWSFSPRNPADYRARLFMKVLLHGWLKVDHYFRILWFALEPIFQLYPVSRVPTGQSTQIQRRTHCPHDPRRGHGLESGWVKVCPRVFCVCVCVYVCAPRPPGGRFSGLQTFSGQTQLITLSLGMIKEQKTVSISLSLFKLSVTYLNHNFTWFCGCLNHTEYH